MSTPMNLGRDINGYIDFSLPIADDKYSVTLTTATDTTLTIPSNYKTWRILVSYEAGKEVWVAINNTAAAPVGATFAATNSVRNRPEFTVVGGDVVHFYTDAVSAVVGVELFWIDK